MAITPEQFSKLVLKQDLDDLEQRLNEKFVSKDYFDQRMDALFEIIDGIATSHKKFEQELAVNQGAHDRMQESINKHEEILKQLAPELTASI